MIATSLAGLAPESDSVLESEAACPVAASAEVFAKSEEAFRTIGEAASELGLKTHVLRFWETKFDNLRPMKRADGRRYYRPDDMEMLRRLQNLLHVQGLTIRGAIKALDAGSPDGEPGLAQVTNPSVGDEGAEMKDPVETGASVRDLQDAVRSAVERGDFGASEDVGVETAKSRLELLLADLTSLKSRLDAVRAA